MAELSEKELIALQKFRVSVVDLDLNEDQQSDDFLLAWLRARDLNVTKAFEMLQKSLAWRVQNDIYNILSWEPPKSISQEFPHFAACEGPSYPVLVAPFGKWDIRKAIESGQKDVLQKYCYFRLAEFSSKFKAHSKNVNYVQFIVLLDYEGYSMRQLGSLANINAILELVTRIESNYPEILKAAYVINASRIFTLLFRVIKPLLTERTLAKINIYGTNQKQWKLALSENIPEDQLPVQYGGRFQHCQMDQNIFKSANDGFKTVIVEPGNRLKIDVNVIQSPKSLSWKFKTDDFDIGFRVIFNDEEDMYPFAKLASHLQDQEGSICCRNFGKYSIIFDNSHSRFRGKTLHYLIQQNDVEDP